MSGNTNTIFWVITGAVIVIALFTLINTSSNTTSNKIFSEFNEKYEYIIDSNIYKSKYENWFIEIKYNRNNNGTVFLDFNIKNKGEYSYLTTVDGVLMDCKTKINIPYGITLGVSKYFEHNEVHTKTAAFYFDAGDYTEKEFCMTFTTT